MLQVVILSRAFGHGHPWTCITSRCYPRLLRTVQKHSKRAVDVDAAQHSSGKIALFIDGDSFAPKFLPEIHATLTPFGKIVWQRAYLSDSNDPRALLAHAGKAKQSLDVKVCNRIPGLGSITRAKSSVDTHLIIDAVNMKYNASRLGLTAYAIVSNDSDFTPLVTDIRASTFCDVFAFARASHVNIRPEYEDSSTRMFRYGMSSGKQGDDTVGSQETELWNTLLRFGYIPPPDVEKFTGKWITKRHHLEMFCHVHGLCHAGVKLRNDLADIVFAKVKSEHPIILKPLCLIHISSSSATQQYTKSRRSVIFDGSNMSRSDIVTFVLRFLGFGDVAKGISSQSIVLFCDCQTYMKLEAQVRDWQVGEQISYLHRIFTGDNYAGIPWTRSPQ
ncbi:unnamed protein product [Polarella glacialis]|uniref:NYN domain-containing protein n=1 Tax=Polarella glacialis TaxID=89957 RepID=A0A813J1D4_POLGL|nr:unnamed protein product [Polarella glacialis]